MTEDTRPAVLSAVIAVVALVVKVAVIPFIARRNPQLQMELSVLGLATLGAAIYAIVLARRAENRLMLTRDKRHLMTAQTGLWVGCAVVIYTVVSFFLWPISHIANNL